MGAFSQLLKAHGDPVKVAEVIGSVVRPAAPGNVQPAFSPASSAPSPTPLPSPMPLNVDRPASIAAAAPSASIAPALSVAPAAAAPSLSAPTWLDWLKAHWPWLLAALLVLLLIAYAGKGGRRESDFSPSPIGKRVGKGSPEMKERMARLRAMKRKR